MGNSLKLQKTSLTIQTMYAPGQKVQALWQGTNPGWYPATVQQQLGNGNVMVTYDQYPQWGQIETPFQNIQPLAVQQPMAVQPVQQPQTVYVKEQKQGMSAEEGA